MNKEQIEKIQTILNQSVCQIFSKEVSMWIVNEEGDLRIATDDEVKSFLEKNDGGYDD